MKHLLAGEEGVEIPDDVIVGTIASLDHWTFGAAQATVRHMQYGLSTPATCTIAYDKLRPMVKAGFPLPQ